MNQFTIEIPEVPEGWKPVAFRPRLPGEPYINYDDLPEFLKKQAD